MLPQSSLLLLSESDLSRSVLRDSWVSSGSWFWGWFFTPAPSERQLSLEFFLPSRALPPAAAPSLAPSASLPESWAPCCFSTCLSLPRLLGALLCCVEEEVAVVLVVVLVVQMLVSLSEPSSTPSSWPICCLPRVLRERTTETPVNEKRRLKSYFV